MTDCKTYRSEIEESANGLSDATRTHASSCSTCGEFLRARESLLRLVGGLERVEAPADFEFRLRARMAARRGTRGGKPFAGRGNLYSFGAVAAALCFLAVSASLYFWQGQRLRPGGEARDNARTEVEIKSDRPQVADISKSGAKTTTASDNIINAAVATKSKDVVTRSVVRQRLREVARARDVKKVSTNNTLIASATSAPVISLTLGNSPETLRVVLRDEHGTARVVPVRAVSFGSQELLARESAGRRASVKENEGVW